MERIKRSEEWRTIDKYPNYEVSNLGRVRSKDFIVARRRGKPYIKKSHLMSRDNNGNGYYKVNLINKDGAKEMVYVHRLVATAFVPNPLNKPHVNHIDNDPSNNSADNLEWCTPKENTDWAIKQNRTVRTDVWIERLKRSMVKSKGRAVIGTCIESGETKRYESTSSVKEDGFSQSSVWACCNNERKTHKGWTWEYENT